MNFALSRSRTKIGDTNPYFFSILKTPRMSALHMKLFKQFKTMKVVACEAISVAVAPLINCKKEPYNVAVLTDLYAEWQAICRASAAALQRTPSANELLPMPYIPIDDEEHMPCRMMAGILIERTIYDEHVVGYLLKPAVDLVIKNPSCAKHVKECACKKILEGWEDYWNVREIEILKAFFNACELEDSKMNVLSKCVFFCYQDLDADATKYLNGKTLHGIYYIVKKEDCYEFTLVETTLTSQVWLENAAKKKVTKFPLTAIMGVGSFVNVTPDKIHVS
jgi:hypothetical protein